MTAIFVDIPFEPEDKAFARFFLKGESEGAVSSMATYERFVEDDINSVNSWFDRWTDAAKRLLNKLS